MKQEILDRAQKEIDRESPLAIDIAVNHGQIFSNVKHTHWFRSVVAEEIQSLDLLDAIAACV